MQNTELIELQEHLERYCKVKPIFGLNNTKNDINLNKSHLLPILNNKRKMKPTVI